MKKLILIVLAFAILSFISYLYYHSIMNATIEQETEQIIDIPYNTPTYKVLEIFNNYGYLKPNWLFKYLITNRIESKKKFINAGIYEIPSKISNKELLDKLFSNDFVKFKKFSVIEGTNIYEFVENYQKTFGVPKQEILNLLYDQNFIKSLNIPSWSIEGYLSPDTYFFLEESPKKHIKKLVDRQKDLLKNISKNKKVELTDYEILILASIIQSEASVDEELPLISSVYNNRLNLGMLLQADPTVLYGKYPQKTITKKDLTNKSNKHNTYIYSGLPPTPINSPGKKAIYAAANPANTNYLYFVLKSDTDKTHYFSTNYNDHLKSVKKYRQSTKK